MRCHQPTKDYVARRAGGGRTEPEILRCLKRYVAHEVYPLLHQPGRTVRDTVGTVAVWDELKIVLAALQQQDPLPLTSFPDPEFDQGRRPPFEIGLAAWATDIAEQLHDRFGGDVMLTVGAMRYPQRALAHQPARPFGISTPVLGPGQATIAWAIPLRVRSGHTAQHDMAITNVGTEQVKASGPLIADVVDLDSGEIVGGYTGAVSLALMIVVVPPGATRQIPVLVGTDSLRPDLGYALPPGEWGARTTLWLAGRPVRTPILPVTITP